MLGEAVSVEDHHGDSCEGELSEQEKSFLVIPPSVHEEEEAQKNHHKPKDVCVSHEEMPQDAKLKLGACFRSGHEYFLVALLVCSVLDKSGDRILHAFITVQLKI